MTPDARRFFSGAAGFFSVAKLFLAMSSGAVCVRVAPMTSYLIQDIKCIAKQDQEPQKEDEKVEKKEEEKKDGPKIWLSPEDGIDFSKLPLGWRWFLFFHTVHAPVSLAYVFTLLLLPLASADKLCSTLGLVGTLLLAWFVFAIVWCAIAAPDAYNAAFIKYGVSTLDSGLRAYFLSNKEVCKIFNERAAQRNTLSIETKQFLFLWNELKIVGANPDSEVYLSKLWKKIFPARPPVRAAPKKKREPKNPVLWSLRPVMGKVINIYNACVHAQFLGWGVFEHTNDDFVRQLTQYQKLGYFAIPADFESVKYRDELLALASLRYGAVLEKIEYVPEAQEYRVSFNLPLMWKHGNMFHY